MKARLRLWLISACIQPHLWKEDLWSHKRLTASFPGQPARLLPYCRPRVLRDGLLPRRRPHDAHPRQCLHWEPDPVGTRRSQSVMEVQQTCRMFVWLLSHPLSFKVLFLVCAAGPGVSPSKQNSLQVSASPAASTTASLHTPWHHLVYVCLSGIWSWTICWWMQMVLSE